MDIHTMKRIQFAMLTILRSTDWDVLIGCIGKTVRARKHFGRNYAKFDIKFPSWIRIFCRQSCDAVCVHCEEKVSNERPHIGSLADLFFQHYTFYRSVLNAQSTVDLFVWIVFWINCWHKNKFKGKIRLLEPCDNCVPPYGFRNHLTLSSDTSSFSVSFHHNKFMLLACTIFVGFFLKSKKFLFICCFTYFLNIVHYFLQIFYNEKIQGLSWLYFSSHSLIIVWIGGLRHSSINIFDIDFLRRIFSHLFCWAIFVYVHCIIIFVLPNVLSRLCFFLFFGCIRVAVYKLL